MGDSKVGVQARLMSQAMRKLTASISKTNCCCIFINQLREKIGVMFGNPETTTGGNALKFYASVRLDIRKSGAAIKDKEGNVVGNQVKVKVVKNKLAPPFRVAQFDIVFGEGISKNGEIIDLGTDFEVIQKSGAWYSYNGAKIAQGRDSAKQFLHDNPEVADEIELKIKEKISAGTVKVGPQAAAMVMLEDDMTEE
jgi:recombination protein RecA